jgi:hypothetical protein
MEVDEKASLDSGQAQVGDHLRFMHRQQAFDGLDLQNETVFDEEVEAVPASQLDPLVLHGYRLLAFEPESSKAELMRQQLLVGRLEQSRPDRAVHLDTRTYHLLRATQKSPRLPVS